MSAKSYFGGEWGNPSIVLRIKRKTAGARPAAVWKELWEAGLVQERELALRLDAITMDCLDSDLAVLVLRVDRDERAAVEAGLLRREDLLLRSIEPHFIDQTFPLADRSPDRLHNHWLLHLRLHERHGSGGALLRVLPALLNDLEGLDHVADLAALVNGIDEDDEGAGRARHPLVRENGDTVSLLAVCRVAGDLPAGEQGLEAFLARLFARFGGCLFGRFPFGSTTFVVDPVDDAFRCR